MTQPPTFTQRERPLTPERRALTIRAADLCRRDGATFAAMVRRADQLRAAGVDYDEALEQALAAAADG